MYQTYASLLLSALVAPFVLACGSTQPVTTPCTDCSADAATTLDAGRDAVTLQSRDFPSGGYFLLVDLEKPFASQIQLFADVVVSSDGAGAVVQFTNADRSTDATRCKTIKCSPEDVCRTLPTESCVIPSQRAGDVDEFSDFVPNFSGSGGYGLLAGATLVHQPNGSVLLTTLEKDLSLPSPAVLFEKFKITMTFARDAEGVWRGTGTVSAASVTLSGNALGVASGPARGRSLSSAQTPSDMPRVPGR